jgi:hypothetical protein
MNFDFFGTLDKKNCIYFYIFSYIGLILFFLGLFTALYGLFFSRKLFTKFVVANLILFLANNFIIYFSNRLFYNMCKNSL